MTDVGPTTAAPGVTDDPAGAPIPSLPNPAPQHATACGTPSHGGQLPEVVVRYAAYLRARTRLKPHAEVNGHEAQLWISDGPATLTLVFSLHRGAWWPRDASLRRGHQANTFRRGQLAHAVTAFLAQQPSTSARTERSRRN